MHIASNKKRYYLEFYRNALPYSVMVLILIAGCICKGTQTGGDQIVVEWTKSHTVSMRG